MFKSACLSLSALALMACSATQPIATDTYSLVGKITVKDGTAAEFAALLSGALDQTNCISCTVLRDNNNANVVWVAEVWPSEAAHDDALTQPAIQAAVKKGRVMIVNMERMAHTDGHK